MKRTKEVTLLQVLRSNANILIDHGKQISAVGTDIQEIGPIPVHLILPDKGLIVDEVKILFLSNNYITSVDMIDQFRNLETVSLANNMICYFENISALQYLPSLKKLSLTGNGLTKLPYYEEFVHHFCPSLESLDGQRIASDTKAKLNMSYSIAKAYYQKAIGGATRNTLLQHVLFLSICHQKLASDVFGRLRFLHHAHVGEIFATHNHENGIHDVWKILREGGVFDWFFQFSQHDFSIFIQNMLYKIKAKYKQKFKGNDTTEKENTLNSLSSPTAKRQKSTKQEGSPMNKDTENEEILHMLFYLQEREYDHYVLQYSELNPVNAPSELPAESPRSSVDMAFTNIPHANASARPNKSNILYALNDSFSETGNNRMDLNGRRNHYNLTQAVSQGLLFANPTGDERLRDSTGSLRSISPPSRSSSPYSSNAHQSNNGHETGNGKKKYNVRFQFPATVKILSPQPSPGKENEREPLLKTGSLENIRSPRDLSNRNFNNVNNSLAVPPLRIKSCIRYGASPNTATAQTNLTEETEELLENDKINVREKLQDEYMRLLTTHPPTSLRGANIPNAGMQSLKSKDSFVNNFEASRGQTNKIAGPNNSTPGFTAQRSTSPPVNGTKNKPIIELKSRSSSISPPSLRSSQEILSSKPNSNPLRLSSASLPSQQIDPEQDPVAGNFSNRSIDTTINQPRIPPVYESSSVQNYRQEEQRSVSRNEFLSDRNTFNPEMQKNVVISQINSNPNSEDHLHQAKNDSKPLPVQFTRLMKTEHDMPREQEFQTNNRQIEAQQTAIGSSKVSIQPKEIPAEIPTEVVRREINPTDSFPGYKNNQEEMDEILWFVQYMHQLANLSNVMQATAPHGDYSISSGIEKEIDHWCDTLYSTVQEKYSQLITTLISIVPPPEPLHTVAGPLHDGSGKISMGDLKLIIQNYSRQYLLLIQSESHVVQYGLHLLTNKTLQQYQDESKFLLQGYSTLLSTTFPTILKPLVLPSSSPSSSSKGKNIEPTEYVSVDKMHSWKERLFHSQQLQQLKKQDLEVIKAQNANDESLLRQQYSLQIDEEMHLVNRLEQHLRLIQNEVSKCEDTLLSLPLSKFRHVLLQKHLEDTRIPSVDATTPKQKKGLFPFISMDDVPFPTFTKSFHHTVTIKCFEAWKRYTRQTLMLKLFQERRHSVQKQTLVIKTFTMWRKLFQQRGRIQKHDKKRRYNNLRSSWKKWRRKYLSDQTIAAEESTSISHFQKLWAWHMFRRRIVEVKQRQWSYRQLLLYSSLFTLVRVYRAWKVYTFKQRKRFVSYANRIEQNVMKFRFRHWYKIYYRYSKSIDEGSNQWRVKQIQSKVYDRKKRECWERWYYYYLLRRDFHWFRCKKTGWKKWRRWFVAKKQLSAYQWSKAIIKHDRLLHSNAAVDSLTAMNTVRNSVKNRIPAILLTAPRFVVRKCHEDDYPNQYFLTRVAQHCLTYWYIFTYTTSAVPPYLSMTSYQSFRGYTALRKRLKSNHYESSSVANEDKNSQNNLSCCRGEYQAMLMARARKHRLKKGLIGWIKGLYEFVQRRHQTRSNYFYSDHYAVAMRPTINSETNEVERILLERVDTVVVAKKHREMMKYLRWWYTYTTSKLANRSVKLIHTHHEGLVKESSRLQWMKGQNTVPDNELNAMEKKQTKVKSGNKNTKEKILIGQLSSGVDTQMDMSLLRKPEPFPELTLFSPTVSDKSASNKRRNQRRHERESEELFYRNIKEKHLKHLLRRTFQGMHHRVLRKWRYCCNYFSPKIPAYDSMVIDNTLVITGNLPALTEDQYNQKKDTLLQTRAILRDELIALNTQLSTHQVLHASKEDTLYHLQLLKDDNQSSLNVLQAQDDALTKEQDELTKTREDMMRLLALYRQESSGDYRQESILSSSVPSTKVSMSIQEIALTTQQIEEEYEQVKRLIVEYEGKTTIVQGMMKKYDDEKNSLWKKKADLIHHRNSLQDILAQSSEILSKTMMTYSSQMEEIHDEIDHYTALRSQLQNRLEELLQQQEKYEKIVNEYHTEKQKLPAISALPTMELIARTEAAETIRNTFLHLPPPMPVMSVLQLPKPAPAYKPHDTISSQQQQSSDFLQQIEKISQSLNDSLHTPINTTALRYGNTHPLTVLEEYLPQAKSFLDMPIVHTAGGSTNNTNNTNTNNTTSTASVNPGNTVVTAKESGSKSPPSRSNGTSSTGTGTGSPLPSPILSSLPNTGISPSTTTTMPMNLTSFTLSTPMMLPVSLPLPPPVTGTATGTGSSPLVVGEGKKKKTVTIAAPLFGNTTTTASTHSTGNNSSSSSSSSSSGTGGSSGISRSSSSSSSRGESMKKPPLPISSTSHSASSSSRGSGSASSSSSGSGIGSGEYETARNHYQMTISAITTSHLSTPSSSKHPSSGSSGIDSSPSNSPSSTETGGSGSTESSQPGPRHVEMLVAPPSPPTPPPPVAVPATGTSPTTTANTAPGDEMIKNQIQTVTERLKQTLAAHVPMPVSATSTSSTSTQ